jgi:hypothetical protein
VQVKQAYKRGELPTDSKDDIVADEYKEATMRETQPLRAPPSEIRGKILGPCTLGGFYSSFSKL